MTDNPLSADDIAEGRRLDKAATPGPFAVSDDNGVFSHMESLHRLAPGKDGWRERIASNMRSEDAELAAWARNHLPALLDAAEALGTARQLLGWFADTDPCEFDHHGGCQAHGHYEPAPGEECPNATALRWLAEHPEESR